MAAASLLVTALIGAIVSPDFQALVVSFGVPATVVAAIALAIAEAWKQVVNNAKLAVAARNEGVPVSSMKVRMHVQPDLY